MVGGEAEPVIWNELCDVTQDRKPLKTVSF